MRAYININQKAFAELAIKSNMKIDLIDATIFEYVYKFAVSNNALKQLIDNKLYIWCSYQKIIDDNPLMNISSKKAIELRLNKLCDLGLLSKFLDKKQGNKTYFNITDLAYTLVIENTNLSNQDSKALSNEDYYNSKLYNSKLDSNIKSNSVKVDSEEIYNIYKDRLKASKKKQSSINNIIKWLKEYSKEDLLKAIDNYSIEKKGSEEKFIKECSNFFGVKDESKGFFIDYINKQVEEKELHPIFGVYKV